MKEIDLVNSERKIEVADENYEAINVHNWYIDHETGHAFRIVNHLGDTEFLHHFISRRVAHWADDT